MNLISSATIRDVFAGGGEKIDPLDERAGVLMISRVFDRVSHRLVMQSKRVMHRGDTVRL